MSKAERRAIQEAHRAAKAGSVASVVPSKKLPSITPSKLAPELDSNLVVVKPMVVLGSKQESPSKEITKNLNDLKITIKSTKESSPTKVTVNPQIPTRCLDVDALISGLGHNDQKIHPSFIRIGLKMNRNVIRGSIPRCVAMLMAIKNLITDYITPNRKELTRDILTKLRINMKFLNECRPLSVGMGTAFDYLQHQVTKIAQGKSDADAKKCLFDAIENYVHDEISCAVKAITQYGTEKIKDGDCILTFGSSLEVQHILFAAHLERKRFKVIVVDAGPEYRGVSLAEFLSKLEVPVSYLYINAATFVIKEATKVLLGAHAILANGYVMSQMGTSQLALLATAHNVPVYVCCATSEFSDAVYTDAFVYNEAAPESYYFKNKNHKLRTYLEDKVNEDDSKRNKLDIVNLLYDVTPPDFISVVITEKGVLPCSSVPAVMRRQVTQKIH